MNDRFRFRVWNKKNKNYETCDLLGDIHLACIGDGYLLETCSSVREDDVSIEQSTGLTDKNGQLIFEGDILRYYSENGNIYIGALLPDQNHQLWFTNFLPGEDMFDGAWQNIVNVVYRNNYGTLEVIGNVNESPELPTGVGVLPENR